MPCPSAVAVATAIEQCRDLGLRTEQGSAVDAFLAACRLRRRGLEPTIRHVNEVVVEMFGLLPQRPEQGRCYLFRPMWGRLEQAGRASVWNITTRASTTSTQLFEQYDRKSDGVLFNDFRGGLRPEAPAILQGILQEPEKPDRRPSWRALAAVLLCEVDMDDEASARTALRDYLGELVGDEIVAMSEMDLSTFTSEDELGVPLLADRLEDEFSPTRLPAAVLPPTEPARQEPAHRTEAVAGTSYDIVGDVVVDPRVERMLETAVRTYRAVLLVGPPGSGKNTLLKRLIARAQAEPGILGLSAAPRLPLTRTPDESWTSFELIGGHTPTADGLRYGSGAVLDAVAADRWLLLDETNRADMDKIFGALLTWLSMDPVELGTLTPSSTTSVTLGWNTGSPASTVEPPEGLAADPEETTEVAFNAGRDWRLLGAYNPQDAQRVFRFGVALSRRFAIVPIPPLNPDQFRTLMQQQDESGSAPLKRLRFSAVPMRVAALG